jgi:DMSO reductase anchor subunit
MRYAGVVHYSFQCLKALFALSLVLSACEAMNAIPSIAVITSSLAKAVAPLLELSVMAVTVIVLFAALLFTMSTTDERLTRVPLLASYLFNGLVTGM